MRSEIFLIIIGMALVTFITRFASLLLIKWMGIPKSVEVWLKHVPTAILTALILPALLLPRGYLDISLNNSYLLAGVIAAYVAFKSRNVVTTLGVGFLVMFTFSYLIS